MPSLLIKLKEKCKWDLVSLGEGPFPNVALIPTGGMNASNAAEYIAVGAFALGAGGDLMDGAALRNGDTQSTTNAAKELLAAVQAARSKKLC